MVRSEPTGTSEEASWAFTAFSDVCAAVTDAVEMNAPMYLEYVNQWRKKLGKPVALIARVYALSASRDVLLQPVELGTAMRCGFYLPPERGEPRVRHGKDLLVLISYFKRYTIDGKLEFRFKLGTALVVRDAAKVNITQPRFGGMCEKNRFRPECLHDETLIPAHLACSAPRCESFPTNPGEGYFRCVECQDAVYCSEECMDGDKERHGRLCGLFKAGGELLDAMRAPVYLNTMVGDFTGVWGDVEKGAYRMRVYAPSR